LKSASHADVQRLAAGVSAAVLLAAMNVSAQSRPAAAAAAPAWVQCAGGAAGRTVLAVRRLTALNDKATVEADVARVFAQREKEQRLSAASLAKARFSIDFLYVVGEGAARQYYYEASKTIPDASGLARVAVSGWLRGDGGQPRSLGSKGELHWIELAPEDPDELPLIPEPPTIPDPKAALHPQGVLATATGHVWVMRRAIGNGPLLVYEVSAAGRVSLRPKSSAKSCT
jgi:hypothetical protein